MLEDQPFLSFLSKCWHGGIQGCDLWLGHDDKVCRDKTIPPKEWWNSLFGVKYNLSLVCTLDFEKIGRIERSRQECLLIMVFDYDVSSLYFIGVKLACCYVGVIVEAIVGGIVICIFGDWQAWGVVEWVFGDAKPGLYCKAFYLL